MTKLHASLVPSSSSTQCLLLIIAAFNLRTAIYPSPKPLHKEGMVPWSPPPPLQHPVIPLPIITRKSHPYLLLELLMITLERPPHPFSQPSLMHQLLAAALMCPPRPRTPPQSEDLPGYAPRNKRDVNPHPNSPIYVAII